MYAVVSPGSMIRKSECITAVMVLPAARAGNGKAAESAATEAIVENCLRVI